MCFPSQPPQQQNEIRLRSVPRSGNVEYVWDHGQSDANSILNTKYLKNLNLGSASLVGEIAQIIANTIFVQNNSSFTFGGVTFSRNGTDIIASFGQSGAYVSIIGSMQKDRETAEKILENLSKGWIGHNERGEFNLDVLSDEIFEGLDDNAKKLMAVLICETIRFNDDGASARMAMRLVINKFENGSTSPFEDVFVRSDGNTPLSIFAASGGKQRMTDQIMGYEFTHRNASIFEQDAAILEENKNFISDDEDGDESSSAFGLNTFQPSTHQMQTRNEGVYFRGFYEEPTISAFSSTVPSPARGQISTVRTFGNHEAMPFNLDELPEEQGTDTLVPLGEHFCQNCNLLYWRPFGRSDEPILNECPNCHSTDFITMIPDENVAHLVIENYMNGGSKAYFQNYIEGIFVEK